MSLILSIDASTEKAIIAVSERGNVLAFLSNEEQKTHATWIHTAISQCLTDAGCSAKDLQAIGATSGPGSYTGLRVGMATAKGLCYALQLPLVAVNTLLVMASAARETEHTLLCPMMDAGRMEVYTALYDQSLHEVMAPTAFILDRRSFEEKLQQSAITFLAAKNKFQAICENANAKFADIAFDASDLSSLIYTKFVQSEFSSLAYLEPLYLKDYLVRIN